MKGVVPSLRLPASRRNRTRRSGRPEPQAITCSSRPSVGPGPGGHPGSDEPHHVEVRAGAVRVASVNSPAASNVRPEDDGRPVPAQDAGPVAAQGQDLIRVVRLRGLAGERPPADLRPGRQVEELTVVRSRRIQGHGHGRRSAQERFQTQPVAISRPSPRPAGTGREGFAPQVGRPGDEDRLESGSGPAAASRPLFQQPQGPRRHPGGWPAAPPGLLEQGDAQRIAETSSGAGSSPRAAGPPVRCRPRVSPSGRP